MLNKSKGDYAYTMIDINSSDVEKLSNDIKNVEEVIRVRVI